MYYIYEDIADPLYKSPMIKRVHTIVLLYRIKNQFKKN